jgi:hypothetical protein
VQVNHAHDSDPSVCFHDAGETFAVVWKRREHVPREATAARMSAAAAPAVRTHIEW